MILNPGIHVNSQQNKTKQNNTFQEIPRMERKGMRIRIAMHFFAVL
jgi:hypothetical protein